MSAEAFVVGVELGTPALDGPERAREVARLLRRVADAVEAGETRVVLYDCNGNRVGRAGVIGDGLAVLPS